MANTARRICYACGKEFLEADMIAFNTGRAKWICWHCYKEGQKAAIQHEVEGKRKGVKK